MCLPWFKELTTQGGKLIWFEGDVARAREASIEIGGICVTEFDRQVAEIPQAGCPASLIHEMVPVLSAAAVFLDPRQIESLVFR